MALPNVAINHQNDALGAVPDSQDGIAGLCLTGVTADGIALATPKVVFTLAEAEALGITADGTNAAAHRHIKEFYDGYRFITGSDVAELYIMLLANTVTLTQMADVTNATGAKKLVEFAQGRIRHLGFAKTPAGDYEPVLTGGVDGDSLTALAKAHELGNYYATAQWPLRTMVEARAFLYANVGSLTDLATMQYPRAAAVVWSTKNDGSASVGFTLGVKAALPVQRKISRVKNGMLGFEKAYIGDTEIKNVAALEAIHDKGYIALRTFANRSGFYFTGEPTATAPTDDYYIYSRGCVIDKAHRIAYDTFVEEIEDDVEVDGDGQLLEGYKMYLEHRIENRISLQMAGEISGVPEFSIPSGQNILANSTTNAVLKITPKGYQSKIVIALGFQNPAIN